jgi:hypothetical protein
MAKQPKLVVPRSRAERIMQVVGIGAVVAMWVYVVRAWPDLPATVATHFDLTGQPDGWNGRATLLELPILATVFFVVFTLFENFPKAHHLRRVTAAHVPAVHSLSRLGILWFKLVLVLGLGFGFAASVKVAHGKATGLPVWYLPAFLGSIAAVGVITSLSARRYRTAPVARA